MVGFPIGWWSTYPRRPRAHVTCALHHLAKGWDLLQHSNSAWNICLWLLMPRFIIKYHHHHHHQISLISCLHKPHSFNWQLDAGDMIFTSYLRPGWSVYRPPPFRWRRKKKQGDNGNIYIYYIYIYISGQIIIIHKPEIRPFGDDSPY